MYTIYIYLNLLSMFVYLHKVMFQSKKQRIIVLIVNK